MISKKHPIAPIIYGRAPTIHLILTQVARPRVNHVINRLMNSSGGRWRRAAAASPDYYPSVQSDRSINLLTSAERFCDLQITVNPTSQLQTQLLFFINMSLLFIALYTGCFQGMHNFVAHKLKHE